MTVGTGRFGPYVQHQKVYVSIPKDTDPLDITLEEAKALLQQKNDEEARKVLRSFDEDPELHILNGRFGPYLQYKGSNYRIPKAEQKRVAEFTLDDCMKLIGSQEEKTTTKPAKTRRTYTRRTR